MVNPYDSKARKTLLSNLSQAQLTAGRSSSDRHSASNNTTAPTTPAQHETQMKRSESTESGQSVDSNGIRRPRPTSLPARKIPLSELSDISNSDDDENHDRHILEVPGVSKMRHSESVSSIGSLTSMYSSAGGKGDYAISGEISFGIWYSKVCVLHVHVHVHVFILYHIHTCILCIYMYM